jgi:hypothetical protein
MVLGSRERRPFGALGAQPLGPSFWRTMTRARAGIAVLAIFARTSEAGRPPKSDLGRWRRVLEARGISALVPQDDPVVKPLNGNLCTILWNDGIRPVDGTPLEE